VDLTDAGQIYQALTASQAEAVIHLGAWSGDHIVPATRTYGDNVQGTFNVFQACADLGITRVVSASTHHVYGVIKAPPVYVPIDEAHPLRPARPYALSKVACEQTADYFVAQWGLEILSFRFLGVRTPSQLDADVERIIQDPGGHPQLLWTRMDARDAATVCRLAVEAEEVEPNPYNITGRQIVLDQNSAELVRHYFGDQVEIREELVGRASPLSCARAEKAFGYRPQYDWSVNQRYPEKD
jgi:nucleoside-diphosphate-sugar epimerase